MGVATTLDGDKRPLASNPNYKVGPLGPRSTVISKSRCFLNCEASNPPSLLKDTICLLKDLGAMFFVFSKNRSRPKQKTKKTKQKINKKIQKNTKKNTKNIQKTLTKKER